MQVRSGVSGYAAAPVDQAELPFVALRVTIEQDVDRLLWPGTAFQEHQSGRTVLRVPESLRRDHTDLGFAVRDKTAHARELGLNGDAQVAVGCIPSEDRVRHRRSPHRRR
jgi:hypothetical protein